MACFIKSTKISSRNKLKGSKMNLRMKEQRMSDISISSIRNIIEQDEYFQYWNKAIGLTFDEFSIIDIDKSIYIKKGKKEIGNYDILIKDGKFYCAQYGMNEAVRQHTLSLIA